MMRGKRLLIAVLLAAIVIAATTLIIFKPYASNEQTRGTFKPYMSLFHLLFEEALSHNILGNLNGELRITEVDRNILQAECKLAFTGHESIDSIEMEICFMPFVFFEGPSLIPIPPPPNKKIILRNGEQIILDERTFNVSTFKMPMVVFGFQDGHVTPPGGENYTIPRITVQFTDGSICKCEYNVTSQFTFWSGIGAWKLTELSGKTERSSCTIFLEKPVPIPTPFGWHLMLQRVFLWENGVEQFVAGPDSDLCSYLLRTTCRLNLQLKCHFSEEKIRQIKMNDKVVELNFRFYKNITIAQWIEPQERSHIETDEDGYRILCKVQNALFILEDNLNEGLEAHILVYSLIDGWSCWAIQQDSGLDETWMGEVNELLKEALT
ncbi:MAG: hypothetical protein QW222_06600 [Candidatus Bathyarchaeia archaeon]